MQDKQPEGNEKSRINKTATSERERDRERELEIAGNIRQKGEDRSPGDRRRAQRTSNDPGRPEDSDRG